MDAKSIASQRAKNERDLASTVAQETLSDLYGGDEKVYNVPGLLVGLVFVLLLLGAGVATLSYLFGG